MAIKRSFPLTLTLSLGLPRGEGKASAKPMFSAHCLGQLRRGYAQQTADNSPSPRVCVWRPECCRPRQQQRCRSESTGTLLNLAGPQAGCARDGRTPLNRYLPEGEGRGEGNENVAHPTVRVSEVPLPPRIRPSACNRDGRHNTIGPALPTNARPGCANVGVDARLLLK